MSPILEAEGFEEFKESLQKLPLKEVKEDTGVLVGEIREAAKLSGSRPKPRP